MSEIREIRFMKSMRPPPGYRVIFSETTKRYHGERTDGTWRSEAKGDRWSARYSCFLVDTLSRSADVVRALKEMS